MNWYIVSEERSQVAFPSARAGSRDLTGFPICAALGDADASLIGGRWPECVVGAFASGKRMVVAMMVMATIREEQALRIVMMMGLGRI